MNVPAVWPDEWPTLRDIAADLLFHDSPLSLKFGAFMRRLPSAVTLRVTEDQESPLLPFICLVALLIIQGDTKESVAFTDCRTLAVMRRCVILEHWRRRGLWRVRYPLSPVFDPPEAYTCDMHPWIRALQIAPPVERSKCMAELMEDGSPARLLGCIPAQDRLRVSEELARFEDGLPEFLSQIEQDFRDSEMVANIDTIVQ